MTNYFAGCTSADAIKQRYRELAMQHHPDRKPPPERAEATRIMQDINAQYRSAIRQAILAIIHRPHIGIEICGAWVWVSGTQRRGLDAANDETLDVLMKAGYRYAGKKQMWYFAGIPGRGRGASIEHIRSRYGSQKIRDEQAQS